MGAETFFIIANGNSPEEAFRNAREEALWNYGHSGYTGTIAEKDSFVMIECPLGATAARYADTLLLDGDPRIDDKWGPAGCIHIIGSTYLFFGWASS